MLSSLKPAALTCCTLLFAGCASHGPHKESFLPTYVLVLTIDAIHMSSMGELHCTANCSVGDFDPSRVPIFHVEDLGYGDSHKFTQMMISPRWHQQDLAVARRWGRCVVERLEKGEPPTWPPVKVTSAYLVRVLAPLDEPYASVLSRSPRDPCAFSPQKK